MQKDTRTGKKTLPSSLCKHVSFRVPTSWGELTQEHLRYVLKLLFIYREQADGMNTVKSWALSKFCGFEVVRKLDSGWLCELHKSRKTFLLNPELLPSIMDHLSWLDHPEEMTVRMEMVEGYKAVDMLFRELPFGSYLILENFYQSYLQTHDEALLQKMFRILYSVPDDATVNIRPYVLLSVFFWYNATKHTYSKAFPHFLKPVAEGQQTGTQESQREMMDAQIRLLTKGDVTKKKAILNVPAWDALTELDALARDSEEFKRKYGK